MEGKLWPQVLQQLEGSAAKIVIDHFGHPDPAARRKMSATALKLYFS